MLFGVSFMIRRVAVFCGSKLGARPAYAQAVREFGAELAARRLGVVYGGAAQGLMGVLADAVLSGDQSVVGVIPHGLARQEFAHPRLTETHFVDSMHLRKAMMAERADAFVALPGGFGTLDELFEAMTWFQVGIHTKPIGILNVEGYYDALLSWIQRGLDDGFVPSALSSLLVVDESPPALLDRLLTHVSPPSPITWVKP